MELLPCCAFPAFLALVVALIVWGIMKARERREALARLAAEMGLEFYAKDPWDLPARYGHFDLFGEGHSRSASNILSGAVDGRTVLLFDYQYTTGSGKNRQTHSFQAAILEWPILAARLNMRRENIFDQIASWVGHDDINFESAEFSRRYHVKCDDRKFAYDLLHARLIEYLLACGDAPTMETAGPLLLLYDSQAGLENFRRLLAIGQEIVRSIPDYVRSARGTGAQTGGQP